MGKFKKGNKGRTPGIPNRATLELRELLKVTIDKGLEELPAILVKMKTNERAEMLVKLLPYRLPRLQAIAVSLYEREEKKPTYDLTRLTDDELRQFKALHEKITIKPDENTQLHS